MKKLTVLLLVFWSAAVFAAEGHHAEGPIEIPLQSIGWQAANLGILLVALFFFLRKSVIEAFQNRRTSFLEQSEKTKSALAEAEKSLADIKVKLAALEQGEPASLKTAQHESEVLKATLIKDAEQSAEKMKKEASQHIAAELNKAKAAVNSAILEKAVSLASQNISAKNQGTSSAQETAFLKQLEQVKA